MPTLREQVVSLLTQKGLLTPQQLGEALNLQKKEGVKFSDLLIRQNFISEEALINFIKTQLNLSHIDALQLMQLKIPPDVSKIIPAAIAREYRLLPLVKDNQSLTLGISSPLTVLDLEEIPQIKDYSVTPVIISEGLLRELIARHYRKDISDETKSQRLEEILGGVNELAAPVKEEINLSELLQKSQEVPVIQATNFILDKAVEAKASDILIEPLEMSTRIRFRVDGILHQIETLPRSFHPFIISRIKVLANLDIAEHRLPQDGQFKIKSRDKEVDLRISVFPSSNGEKIAVRILDKSLGLLDLDKLSLRQEILEKIKKAAIQPYGMILVCGPTGSGKTSTLYSILKHIHTPEKNIITVEDPVEYRVKGVNQVPVNLKTGMSFSRALRSILRQDPDIIMIGEIRDFETVDIAIKAALTGHLVLSTLHTTTAAGSLVRLLDMGVEPFLINASLVCIISQRLARRICPHCKEKIASSVYFRGRGCKECLSSGYIGRILISELLYMTNEIKEAIGAARLEEQKIKELARSQGMKTLREEGEALALDGITTQEEVLRVTPAD